LTVLDGASQSPVERSDIHNALMRGRIAGAEMTGGVTSIGDLDVNGQEHVSLTAA